MDCRDGVETDLLFMLMTFMESGTAFLASNGIAGRAKIKDHKKSMLK